MCVDAMDYFTLIEKPENQERHVILKGEGNDSVNLLNLVLIIACLQLSDKQIHL